MYLFSIDIEHSGYEIFAIGVSIYKYYNQWNFEPKHIEDKLFVCKFDNNSFEKKCWDELWSKHIDVLDKLKKEIKYENEMEMIIDFYNYYNNFCKKYLTNDGQFDGPSKYIEIRIISDNVSFDVAELNNKILKYMNISSGLSKQMDNYIIPFDTTSYCYGIVCALNLDTQNYSCHNILKLLNDKYKIDIIHDHNPVNDAKKEVLQLMRIMNILYRINNSKLKLIC